MLNSSQSYELFTQLFTQKADSNITWIELQEIPAGHKLNQTILTVHVILLHPPAFVQSWWQILSAAQFISHDEALHVWRQGWFFGVQVSQGEVVQFFKISAAVTVSGCRKTANMNTKSTHDIVLVNAIPGIERKRVTVSHSSLFN